MSKVSTKPKTFGQIQSYAFYINKLLKEDLSLRGYRAYNQPYGRIITEDNKIKIDYPTYKKILALYYIKAGVKLINGYTVDLMHNLGCLFILRRQRNPANPRLDRVISSRKYKELKASGKPFTNTDWMTFYTDDEYIRIKWAKAHYHRNIRFYKFSPANGQAGKGFKQIMSRAISSNKSLLALYPFIPYTPAVIKIEA